MMKDIDAFAPCRSILVVAAHADDLETMCGGTLIQLLAQGKRVDLLLATDGDLGSSDPALAKPALAVLRREEARRAAKLLGLGHVEFLGYHDGELVNNLTLRRQVAHVYRRLQPDTIFTFDPIAAYRGNLHPDHMAVGRAALDAFMPAKMPLYHPEQLARDISLSQVKHIFCFSTPEPDIVVPIDEVYEEKLAISMVHKSQFPDGEKSLEWMKERDRTTARQYAQETVQFAEAFRSIRTY
ncbi:MAG: PIG-L family deacetylase [Chloroflexota bacterium]|nr:PIG-L family deacetylase [Chloroflexota bacterium]